MKRRTLIALMMGLTIALTAGVPVCAASTVAETGFTVDQDYSYGGGTSTGSSFIDDTEGSLVESTSAVPRISSSSGTGSTSVNSGASAPVVSSAEDEGGTKDTPYDGLSKDSKNTARVSASAVVPDIYTADTHILFHNAQTEKYYLIRLNKADDFTGHIYVPAGGYIVDEIKADTVPEKYSFMVDQQTFNLEDNGVLDLAVRMSNYDEINNEGTEEGGMYEDASESDAEALDTAATEVAEYTSPEGGAVVGDAAVVPDVLPWRKVTHRGKGNAEISFDGLSNGSFNVQVEITHSGKAGEGRYRLNYLIGDDKKAAGEEQTIPSDGKLPLRLLPEMREDGEGDDTGLTISFDTQDQYQIGDIYTFSTETEWKVDAYRTESNTSNSGKVYMAGVPAVDKTFDYVIRIVEGGIPGEATYQLSRNGGDSWKNEAVIPADGKIVDSAMGVTIWLSGGDYEAGNSYSAELIGHGAKDYSAVVVGSVAAAAAAVLIVIMMILKSRSGGPGRFRLRDE